MVTIRDVADLANVSASTVSRVVRGLPLVSPAARFRVEQAIEQLGYRPDSAARSIRTGTSHAVGYVVPDISNSTYSMVFRGAEPILADAGYELVLATSDFDPARERRAIESLLSHRIDGLILSLIDAEEPYLTERLAGIPTILIDRESTSPSADILTSDHAAGMRTAVNHLIDLGHRRIAFLGGVDYLYTTHARVGAFREATRARGLSANDCIERLGDRSVEAGERHSIELLTSADPPTAIIAGSNQLLNGTLRAINVLDLVVPDDISVIGCDDSEISYVYRPGISVIKRDIEELGREAAHVLLGRFRAAKAAGSRADSPAAARRVRKVLPTEFVLRGSTGRPRTVAR